MPWFDYSVLRFHILKHHADAHANADAVQAPKGYHHDARYLLYKLDLPSSIQMRRRLTIAVGRTKRLIPVDVRVLGTILHPGTRHGFLSRPIIKTIALAGALRALPPLVADVAGRADGQEERAVAGPGAPRPACALSDGQVVPAEAEPGEEGTDHGAADDVEAGVSVVDVAGGGDVQRAADGDEREDEEIHRRSGGLVSRWDGSVGGTLLAGALFEGGWEDGAVLRVVLLAEEGDGDGEFGAEEQREVEEAGPAERGMSGGPGGEAVTQDGGVCLLADAGSDEDGCFWVDQAESADVELVDSAQIGVASLKEIWSRLSCDVLESLCYHECTC